MNRIKTYTLLFNCLCLAWVWPGAVYAQTPADTLRKLNAVTITGTKKILFDPALRPRLEVNGNGPLVQTLMDQNLLFVKTYGPGLLSTLSSRGTDAVHTPILWHGFSLQNTVNATPDPAIENLPGNYRAAYYAGGQSGLYGSGAMGGTLHLTPSYTAQDGTWAYAGLDLGSFGRHSETFRLGSQNEKTYAAAEVRLSKAKNDFTFVNRALVSKPVQKLSNAEALGTSVNADFRHRWKKRGQLTASLWYQFNRRQIPPTLITSSGHAEQVDENARAFVGWNHSLKGHNLALSTAFLYDYLFYNDDALVTPSLMVQYTALSRVEYDHTFLKNQHVFAGLNHSYYKVYMLEYKGVSPQRNQTALFLGYRYTLPKNLGEASVQAVEELTDGKFVPFCPALSVLLRPKPYLPIRVRVNRNYRQPTFNDLYWVPGGNPNLKPELGFSQEAGIGFEKKYTKKSGMWNVAVFATGFHNSISNRIAWVPGPIFWAPENIDRTRAYGAETDAKLTWGYLRKGLEDWGITLSANYSYTRSVRAKPRFEGDPAYGKQLLYIPMHLGSAGMELRYKNTRIFYRHRFTGLRYTLTDNSQSIAGFHTGTVGISQSVTVMGITANLFFVCDNVADAAYEVLEYRPMPGRNYRGGLSLSFHRKFFKKYD